MSTDQPIPSSAPADDSRAADETGPTRVLRWLTAAHVWTVFGLALSSLLLGLAVVGSAVATFGGRGEGWWRRLRTRLGEARELLLPVAAYALFYVASAATSSVSGAWEELGSDVFTLLGLPLFLLWVRGAERVRWVIRGCLVSITACALWGLGQYAFTDLGPVWRRIPGPFSHYMTFSGVLLIGVLILLSRLVRREGRQSVVNWILLAVIALAMALTLTRHVWIATLAACSIVVWVAARRWTPAYVAALLVAGLALSACAPDHWGRVRSIVDLDDASNYDRLCMMWSGARMIGDRPAFGLGPGAVAEAYPIYRHPTAPRPDAKHLHNTFIQMAAERGLPEVAAYLWLMAVAARAGYRGYRRQLRTGGRDADLYFLTFLAVLVFNFAGLFEANWRDTEVCRLMLFLVAIPWCLRTSPPPSEGAAAVAAPRAAGAPGPAQVAVGG